MVKGQVLHQSNALLYKRAINNTPGQFFIHTVNKKDPHVATGGLIITLRLLQLIQQFSMAQRCSKNAQFIYNE